MGVRDLSSVAYKKGNWMRYTLWALCAVAIIVLALTFVNSVNGEISAAVPKGYRFAVTDNYAAGSNVRTTYYVYEGKIFAEDESFENDKTNRVVLIYDNINTDLLAYDENDTITLCELGTCDARPKVLAVIKQLISRKVGREYIGL